MSKRHFKALAAALSIAAKAAELGKPAGKVVAELAEEIARICAEENPRFDRDRFAEACKAVQP